MAGVSAGVLLRVNGMGEDNGIGVRVTDSGICEGAVELQPAVKRKKMRRTAQGAGMFIPHRSIILNNKFGIWHGKPAG
jgi:hypothetical protein